jgi:hypothetical protein
MVDNQQAPTTMDPRRRIFTTRDEVCVLINVLERQLYKFRLFTMQLKTLYHEIHRQVSLPSYDDVSTLIDKLRKTIDDAGNANDEFEDDLIVCLEDSEVEIVSSFIKTLVKRYEKVLTPTVNVYKTITNEPNSTGNKRKAPDSTDIVKSCNAYIVLQQLQERVDHEQHEQESKRSRISSKDESSNDGPTKSDRSTTSTQEQTVSNITPTDQHQPRGQ